MQEIINMFFKPKKEDPQEEIREELLELKHEIETVRNTFEFQNDRDMIDSSIYALNALMARYKYLIKLAKEMDNNQVIEDKYA